MAFSETLKIIFDTTKGLIHIRKPEFILYYSMKYICSISGRVNKV